MLLNIDYYGESNGNVTNKSHLRNNNVLIHLLNFNVYTSKNAIG